MSTGRGRSGRFGRVRCGCGVRREYSVWRGRAIRTGLRPLGGIRRAAAAGLLLLLGACGGERPEQGAAAGADSAAAGVPADSADPLASMGPKACDVVTTAELTRITGIALEEGRLTNDYMGVSQCRWRRADGTDTGVSISVRQQGDMSIYTSVPGSTPATGIGDQAVWHPETRQLAFKLGPRTASITFLFPEGREAWAREIAASIVEAFAAAPPPAGS